MIGGFALRRYNFFRPLMIILVAFLANNITMLICAALGVAQETAETIAVLVMVAAAIVTYMRLTRPPKS